MAAAFIRRCRLDRRIAVERRLAHPDCGDRLTPVGMDLAGVCFHASGAGRLGVGDGRAAYGFAGFVAIGVAFYVRRSALGGAELALYWLGLVRFIGLAVFSLSIITLAQTPSYLPIAALALVLAAWLITVRRNAIGGLEFAVYWFGLTLIVYAAGIGLVTSTFFRVTELGAFFEVRPRRAPGILLLSAIGSGLAILAWRNRRLRRPELALYLLGIAYWLSVWIRLVQE